MQQQSTPERRPRDKRKPIKTSTPGVYKRGPGSYFVMFRDQYGQQRKRYARTLAEARKLKATLTADVARGEHVEESKLTFAEYAASWIETYTGRTSRGIRPETLADYRRQLGVDEHGQATGHGAVAFFGRTLLKAIRPQDVKRYAQHVAVRPSARNPERPVARNTVRLALAPVRAMLATAFEEGLIRTNPAAGLRLAHVASAALEAEERKALTEKELRVLLAEVPERHRFLVQFLAQTGLRISEALALTKADIDFGRKRVLVRRRLYRGALAPPKTRHGRRDVPLSPSAARALWTRLATASDDSLVFPDPSGGYYDRSYLYRVVKAAGGRTGLSWVGLHTLRHTCASILFRRGLNAKQVQAWLGHHSAAFTLTTYVHLMDDDLPDAAILEDLVHASDQLEDGLVPDRLDQFQSVREPGQVGHVVR